MSRKRDLFGKISLSARTVTRRIEDLSSDIRKTLQERAQQFEFYAIFVGGINATFDITELTSLVSLKDTTTGENIFQVIISVIGSLGLHLSNICWVTTDGAPAMVGKVKGAVSLIEKEMRNAGIERKLVRTHCLIHFEALCGKISEDAGSNAGSHKNCELCACKRIISSSISAYV